MKEAAIQQELSGILDVITSSPLLGKTCVRSLQGMYQSQARPEGQAVDASLANLRLQVKYLLFDLEATRRENRYLRQMLENRTRRENDDLRGEGPEDP